MARQELARGIAITAVATPADLIYNNNTLNRDIQQVVLKIINENAAPVVFTAYVRDNAALAVASTDLEDKVTVPIGGTKYMEIPLVVDDDQILGLVDANDVDVTVYEDNP